MFAVRAFGFGKRKSAKLRAQVIEEQRKDAIRRNNYYTNVQANQEFETLVLHMMMQKEQGQGRFNPAPQLLKVQKADSKENALSNLNSGCTPAYDAKCSDGCPLGQDQK
ncbi:hypothetical protein TWF694_006653 [Orbilia ellipsospora]|uniref:Uncharacterized protein n=1 Tax=Orbilia ellipsospora TaxID=2528407 RepID=A0AAV9XKU4_9PEZI